MATPVRLPDLGAPSVRLSVWFAEPGDHVYEGDRLVEVLLGAATFDVSAPATGRLRGPLAAPEEELTPGQVLGFIEEDAAEDAG